MTAPEFPAWLADLPPVIGELTLNDRRKAVAAERRRY
jgi:hypothetical protein